MNRKIRKGAKKSVPKVAAMSGKKSTGFVAAMKKGGGKKKGY